MRNSLRTLQSAACIKSKRTLDWLLHGEDLRIPVFIFIARQCVSQEFSSESAPGYEKFSPEEEHLLEHFVTNSTGSIFALKNLPEVVKGALFSRYSRSPRGLRSLLLEEFIANDKESEFRALTLGQSSSQGEIEQGIALKKAQDFYNRILDGYGDDSIGELGGAHLAIENVSMLAAKAVESSRIGGSPLEKSTRYLPFDEKIGGDYRFYREPMLMASAHKERYLSTCRMLFDAYARLITPVTALVEQQTPKQEHQSLPAYRAALRARVFDLLRGLLPAATLTNMGVYGNGRFFEQLIHKLEAHRLSEVQEIGRKSYEELEKVIPSFVRRAHPNHKTHQDFLSFYQKMHSDLEMLVHKHGGKLPAGSSTAVCLIDSDPKAVAKVAAALLFPMTHTSFDALMSYCERLSQEDVAQLFDAATDAREQRRHKSPRALEYANFIFDITTDFGAYRDLQRHRILTQQQQLLTCFHGFYIPAELMDTPMEKEYVRAMNAAKEAYDCIAQDLPVEAQYVVPMAYKIRFSLALNLRALQWICELRSSPAGHENYREVAQQMARCVIEKFPLFERFFKFVDYSVPVLGRLQQEEKNLKRQQRQA